MTDLCSYLENSPTIAVVGCSERPERTSHRIARYLVESGFDVIPVNPSADRILDRPCYPDLASIPSSKRVDIVNIFRRPEHTEAIVHEAARRGDARVIWTQIGVSSEDARHAAEGHGLDYVANRCIMVEHGRCG